MDESTDKMKTFYCPVEYDPRRRYTRDEMLAAIKPHQDLLCFFAQASGYQRCVLGLDFDQYDLSDTTVPVLVMESAEAKVLLKVHGRRFRQAYRLSGPRKPLLVTFTDGRTSGWFTLDWQLDAERVFVEPPV